MFQQFSTRFSLFYYLLLIDETFGHRAFACLFVLAGLTYKAHTVTALSLPSPPPPSDNIFPLGTFRKDFLLEINRKLSSSDSFHDYHHPINDGKKTFTFSEEVHRLNYKKHGLRVFSPRMIGVSSRHQTTSTPVVVASTSATTTSICTALALPLSTPPKLQERFKFHCFAEFIEDRSGVKRK